MLFDESSDGGKAEAGAETLRGEPGFEGLRQHLGWEAGPGILPGYADVRPRRLGAHDDAALAFSRLLAMGVRQGLAGIVKQIGDHLLEAKRVDRGHRAAVKATLDHD